MEHDAHISRRDWLLRAATLAGVTATATLIPVRHAHAQQKASKAAMKYQDTPNNGQTCAQCTLFQPPHGCAVVDGDINPQGWCIAYSKKT